MKFFQSLSEVCAAAIEASKNTNEFVGVFKNWRNGLYYYSHCAKEIAIADEFVAQYRNGELDKELEKHVEAMEQWSDGEGY